MLARQAHARHPRYARLPSIPRLKAAHLTPKTHAPRAAPPRADARAGQKRRMPRPSCRERPLLRGGAARVKATSPAQKRRAEPADVAAQLRLHARGAHATMP